ncbi:MAG TPA: LuxR C-terminal-related transcriptional regulator [Egibacteraceae bacterium]
MGRPRLLRLHLGPLSSGRLGEAQFVSAKTAGVHVSNILAKLGVTSRVEAATIAHRIGLVAAE